MSAPYHHIKRKVEDAFASAIAGGAGDSLIGRATIKGFSLGSLTGDRVHIESIKAEPELIGGDGDGIGGYVTGNWMVDVSISIVTVAMSEHGYDRDSHAQACGAVEDVLLASDIVARLTGADVDDLAVMAWRPGASSDMADNETMEYVTSYEGTLYCAPVAG